MTMELVQRLANIQNVQRDEEDTLEPALGIENPTFPLQGEVVFVFAARALRNP